MISLPTSYIIENKQNSITNTNEYYTIIMKYYGLPDYCNIDLGKEEDCFLFDTEQEAKHCIELCFENGAWFNDLKYGKVRYYVEKKKYNYSWIEV